jgi:hypothetical protein
MDERVSYRVWGVSTHRYRGDPSVSMPGADDCLLTGRIIGRLLKAGYVTVLTAESTQGGIFGLAREGATKNGKGVWDD